MLKHFETTLHGSSFARGTNIEGTVTFSSRSTRNTSDFVLTVGLKGLLHTSIPTSSGIKSHANKMIYFHSKTFASAGRNNGITHIIPFSYPISSLCPISTSYQSMASVQYTLETSIIDLCLGREALCSAQEDVTILSQVDATRGDSVIHSAGKLRCTANSVIAPSSKYFLQIASPSRYLIKSTKIILCSNIDITDGLVKFHKSTERNLTDFDGIHRTLPDGSNLAIYNVDMPAELAPSLEIKGFRRNYGMKLHVDFVNKPAVALRFDVIVVPGTVSSKHKSTTIFGQSNENTTTQKPLVRDQDTKISSSIMQDLTMNQLSALALSTTPSAVVVSQSTMSRKSSTSSYTSSSKDSSLSHSSASPKSVASSFSDSCSSHSSPSPSRRANKVSTKTESLASPTPVYSRRKNSLSSATHRLSARLSFSGFGKKTSKSEQSLDFSCRGPQESPMASTLQSRTYATKSVPKLDMTTFSFPRPPPQVPANAAYSESNSDSEDTTGSCYSSMPSSPSTEACPSLFNSPSRLTTLSRRLSFKAVPKREIPYTDNRFSLSACYLSGFNFEGLSSLDTQDIDELEDAFAMDITTTASQGSLGLAI